MLFKSGFDIITTVCRRTEKYALRFYPLRQTKFFGHGYSEDAEIRWRYFMQQEAGFFAKAKSYFAAKKHFFTAKNIAYLAVLLALVIVLQIWGGLIRIGTTPLSFVLVPIVLGGILLGVWAGCFLGFVFGLITLLMGLAADPFTSYLFASSPVMTILICLVKGTAAGLVPALVYKALKNKNSYVAIFLAAACAPIANTGIFIIGCLIISGTMTGWMEYAVSQGWMETVQALPYYLFIVLAGINFIIEFAINLILAPAIHRVVIVVEKQFGGNTKKKNSNGKAEDTAISEPELKQ